MQHFAQEQIAPQSRGGMLRTVSEEGLALKDISINGDSKETGSIGSKPVVDTLTPNDSQQMVERLSKVFNSSEGLKVPSRDEIWEMTQMRLPIINWAQKITRSSLQADLVAGMTVCIMVVPQSMSYADIAGMPYIYGLYATLIPTLIYAFTGNSRQLAVGPTALISILTNAALDGLLTEKECPAFYDGSAGDLTQAELCPDAYVKLAILTAFVVGIAQTAGAFLQLGFIVSFLGHPVVSGFTSAAAFLIGLTQVKNLLGFKIKKSEYIYVTVGEIFNKIHKTNYVTCILGISFVAMLIATKKVAQKYKKFSWLRPMSPLIFCLVGSVIVYTSDLDTTSDVDVVGPIKSGFPPISTDYELSDISRVIGPSITIIIISYMESVAISKSLAAQHGYEVEPTQELFALGLANLFGSMLSAFPVTGSFSRSAVANAVGAKTQLAGLITCMGVILTTFCLTPIFAYLPKFVLGAIVVSSVVNLIAYQDAIHLWKVKKSDCFLWFLAFFGTLFLGILIGILGAAAVSIIIVIHESVRPQVSLIWRVRGTNFYRSVKQSPDGVWVKGVLIVRFGASMYFANTSYIRDTIMDLINVGGSTVKYVILEMSPVISVDSSAIHTLEDMTKDFKKRGIYISFANVGNRVMKVLQRAHFSEHIGQKWFHGSTSDAVEYCVAHRARRSTKKEEDSV